MGITTRVKKALNRAFGETFVRLENDDGITGFVVSPRFKGVSSLDRQTMIEEAVKVAGLSKEERRRILMIAGVTPVEFDSAGARLRVRRVKPGADGRVRVVLQGGAPDARYVQQVLKRQAGVRASKPRRSSHVPDSLMTFAVKGPEDDPMTKDRVIQLLKNDRYVEVMPDA